MELRKSETDRMIFGVCGGIAQRFGWDSTLVRIVFSVAVFAAVGSPILLYLVLAFIMPKEYEY